MPRPTVKQCKQEILDFVVLALRDKYDALKTSSERPTVTLTGNSIRVRFAEFKDDAPIYVRVDIRGEP
jgi:hypothetical protein